MARPPNPVFLERKTYRRRRLGDAAKLLPLFGLAVFMLPILWSDTARTSDGIIYLFSAWVLLILVVATLSRRLAAAEAEANAPDPASEG